MQFPGCAGIEAWIDLGFLIVKYFTNLFSHTQPVTEVAWAAYSRCYKRSFTEDNPSPQLFVKFSRQVSKLWCFSILPGVDLTCELWKYLDPLCCCRMKGSKWVLKTHYSFKRNKNPTSLLWYGIYIPFFENQASKLLSVTKIWLDVKNSSCFFK